MAEPFKPLPQSVERRLLLSELNEVDPDEPAYLYGEDGSRHLAGQNNGPEIGLALCGTCHSTKEAMIRGFRTSPDAAFHIRRSLHAPVCGKCCEIGARTGGLGIDQQPRAKR